MRKSFLLKTFLLVILLAAVLAVIVATMRSDSGGAAIEAAQTQTFFKQFVISGGPIVWFVLLPMSLVMVFLAAEHGFTIRRKKLLPEGIGKQIVEIIRRFGPGKLKARIADRNDFVSTAVVKAVTQGRGDWFRMRNALAESLQEQAWGFLRRIEWLSLIGNVSPMVGLFGTVFGMIKLFNAIVTAGGQPQPSQLADGISIALVTTFWGLFIAIPALAIHGVFRNRIETLVSDAVVEAENIVPEIRRSLNPVRSSVGKSVGPASVRTSNGVKKQSQAEPRRIVETKQPIRELGSKPTGTIGESLPLR
jgi:biopolymer transport protein ExbB